MKMHAFESLVCLNYLLEESFQASIACVLVSLEQITKQRPVLLVNIGSYISTVHSPKLTIYEL